MIALCATQTSWGVDFVAGGIKYSINSNGSSVTVVANTEEYIGDIVIPATIGNGGMNYRVTAIGNFAFSSCRDMTSITLNEGLETIGDRAFQNCSKLKSLMIPNSVTSLGQYMCAGCSLLETVTIGDGVKVIPYRAFEELGSLESVKFGKKVEGTEYGAFGYCPYLKDIEFPGSLKTIGNASFKGCTSFVSVTLPSSVRSIGTEAFSDCTDMTSITLNEELETIGDRAFQNCSKLKGLVIPNSVTSLGQYMCAGCSLLESVTIGDGVKVIPYRAFEELGSLESVTFGKKVEELAYGAFLDSKSIKTIRCTNTKPAIWSNLNNTFSSSIYSVCILYVPAGTLETYKTAPGWENFFNIVEGEGEPTDDATTVIETSGYATYCSEYDLDFTNVVGLKAYIASGHNRATGTVLLTRVKEVPAGTGLVLIGNPGAYKVKIVQTQYYYMNMLKGTLTVEYVPETKDGYINYIFANGPQGVNFYKSSGGNIGANKAYLRVPIVSSTSEARMVLGYTFEDDEDNETTDIAQPQATLQNDAIYNLNGQRVDQPRKGLYIKNGKKVFIR